MNLLLACRPVTLKFLLFDYFSLKYPLKYELNQDISLNSETEIDCQNSYALQRLWTIARCNISTNSCAIINLQSDIRLADSELIISAKRLSLGIYKIELTAQLITTSDTYVSSSTVYIQIIPSSLVYVFVTKSKTTVMTIGKNQDLLLEPGSYSVDGDGNNIKIDVCSFSSCKLFTFDTSSSFS